MLIPRLGMARPRAGLSSAEGGPMVDFVDPALMSKLVLLAIVLVLLWLAVKIGQFVIRIALFIAAVAVAIGAVYYIFLR